MPANLYVTDFSDQQLFLKVLKQPLPWVFDDNFTSTFNIISGCIVCFACTTYY